MNLPKLTLMVLALVVLSITSLHAGPLSIGNFTQVKLEYQYTDYGEYTYPNPMLFEYPEKQYTQPLPYIADFPENRAMLRITQGIGFNDELQLRYQYSDLTEDNHQDLFNIKYQRSLTDNIDGHVSTQLTRGIEGFEGRMFEGGGKIDWAGFVLASGSYAYYTNDSDTASSDAHSFQLKLRQTLTKSTAFQVRHDWFYTKTENTEFTSNTLTFWLSQFFPTQTIVHLEFREHWDTAGLTSHAPGIEIDHMEYILPVTDVIRFIRNKMRINDTVSRERSVHQRT